MTRSSRTPLLVRCYARLFRFFMPDGFRQEMGTPALETFEDLYWEARDSGGRVAVARHMARELASLFIVAYRERFGSAAAGDAEVHRKGLIGRRRYVSLLDEVRMDVRVGLRQMTRSPGFATVAILALTLGIGLNTITLSVGHAVFVEPLPYPDSDRLGIVSMERFVSNESGFSASLLELSDISERNRVFEDVSYFLDWQSVNLSGGDTRERVAVNFVTANYFDMLGFRAIHGRAFTLGETDELRDPVLVLSHALWERNFGGDPSVVGRKVVVNGLPFEIVGIVSDTAGDLGQRFEQSSGVYLPLPWTPRLAGLSIYESRRARYLFGLTRWKPGTSLEEARDDLHRISSDLSVEFPDTNDGWRFLLQPLRETLYGQASESTLILAVGAALVLLLVCVNLAGLMLVQGDRRTRELAVRHSLGAGARRVRRQLLTESTLLSVIGGTAGAGLAVWGTRLLASSNVLGLPGFASPQIDARALLATFALATTTALLFGIVPAFRASRVTTLRILRQGVPVTSGGPARAVFLAVEVALSVVLMVGAVLTLESFYALRTTEMGFDAKDLLTARIDLRGTRYEDGSARRSTSTELIRRSEALPGVSSAFLWSPSRLGGGNWVRFVTREGNYDQSNERIEASRHHIYPDTFRKLGIPLLEGRDFVPADTEDVRRVMIISLALAASLYGDDSAVGRRIESGQGNDTVSYEIVGVVGNAKHRSRVETWWEADYDVYVPYSQEPEAYLSLLLRIRSGIGAATATAVREMVREVDATLPVYDVGLMEDRLRQEETRGALSAFLVSSYASVAMALAALGIYGTLALAVSQRNREIGIRMALGARSRNVVREVMGEGVKVVLVGAVIGSAGSFFAAKLLTSVLFGVTSLQLTSVLAVALGLGAVGLSGFFLPARSASRVDPTLALRDG